jgi:hypothetical protein
MLVFSQKRGAASACKSDAVPPCGAAPSIILDVVDRLSRSAHSFFGSILIFLFVVPCLAGFQASGVRESSVQHDNRTAYRPYQSALRVRVIPSSVYQRPPGGSHRETRASENSRFPNPLSKIGETAMKQSKQSMRNYHPPRSIPSLIAALPEAKRNAEMNLPSERSRGLDFTAAPEIRARINSKFEHSKNQVAGEPGITEQRRDRLDHSRLFLLNLIDLGYAPSLIDSWCDDLLDDEVVDGMSMDLVNLYWGPPVETQEFVEYYIPYQLCTYRTERGDYRQVTYKNRIVAEPKPSGTNFQGL